MQPILSELLDHYNRFVPEAEPLQEIESAHQSLLRSLDKPERRLVLSIIDNKDLISGDRARDSFECGFWLAWRLFSQLHTDDSGRSLERILDVDGRFAVPEAEPVLRKHRPPTSHCVKPVAHR